MFLNKRTTAWFVASMALTSGLVLSSLAAPPGKGGGRSSPPPPSLPADLHVRYRVEFVPLPPDASNTVVHDVNDVREAVGAFDDVDGFRVGYYYDADADRLLTANQMIPDLPAELETSFTGINNHGAIVGMVRNIFGFRQCILVRPNLDLYGNEDGTYSWEISSPDDASGPMESHFTKINDSGDIVGISWDGDGVGFAFAYNPGLPIAPQEDFLDFTFFGPAGAWWNSMHVTNARLGTVSSVGGEMFGFNFINGLPQLSANEGFLYQPSLGSGASGQSNDGQIIFNERLVQQKGKNVSYRWTPGIMDFVSGQPVWQGNLDDGYATLVNSKAVSEVTQAMNTVGDVVGFNEISGVRWLRHADRPDWGYLDLGAMVVFSSPADAELWSSIPGPGVRVWGMSDRDPATGFGVLIGHNTGFVTKPAYVLIPEFVP